MGTLFQDVKFGLRVMGRTPVVTLVAVVSLALGIAANASMFSLLSSFILEPFPYRDQDHLAMLRTKPIGEGIDMAGMVSVPNFRDFVAAGDGIEEAALYTVRPANLTGLDTPEQLGLVVATPSLFDVLGVQPELGRGFRGEEGVEGAGNVLVLGHDYWQRRFLGDPDVLGRVVTLDGTPHTIVGVMPEDFELIPANVQAYRPSDFADQMEDRASQAYFPFLRLTDGATVDRLQLQLDGLYERLVAEYPDALTGTEIVVQPAREFFPGPTDRSLYAILTVVTIFGLLIACANIANLLLSRADERQQEVAVRTAMGAGHGRVLRQLLTESVVMGVIGGVLGLVFAIWVVRWMRSIMPPEIPRFALPELNPGVVAVTIALSMVAGVIFGIAPALQSVTGNLRESLGGGARGGTAGRRRKRLRNAFVVGEVAVALALLSGAGFLIQAFDQLSNGEEGFRRDGLLTFDLTVLGDRYTGDPEVIAYERELVRVLDEMPSVEGVAVMSSLPRGTSSSRTSYTVAGRPEPEPSERPTAGLQVVNPRYFETMEVELREGRLIGDADRGDSPRVAVISEALAAREFPDSDPIGEHLTVENASWEIVGVVEDIYQERMQLAGDAGELIYVPMEQRVLRSPSFALRTNGDPTALAADVRTAVWSVEADQPIATPRTLEAFIAESLAGPRAVSAFLLVLGAIALVLAAMGIYGVMAQSVAQQQREIGIRMALGADPGRVVGMVTRSGLSLVGIGILVGLPIALFMLRTTVSSLNLFNVDIRYGYPILLSAALVIVAILSTILPAQRASAVPPVAALKD
ncbi:MAG: ABC transporter permease [Gemmatimonadota bacterium]|jgi:putative ABC transport system permease protein